jgi:molybdopterin biosynthesis enzyme
MLTYEEALREVLAQVPEPKVVRVPLRKSQGRVLPQLL